MYNLAFNRCVTFLPFTFRGLGNIVVQNSIFLDYELNNNFPTFGSHLNVTTSGMLPILHNNIFVGSNAGPNLGAVTDNMYNVPRTDILVGWPTNTNNQYSFDKRFQLLPNSPARNYATDGGDCGPYGGPTPYVPSGAPGIPDVYNLTVPAQGTTGGGVDVNVRVRTQN